MKVRDIGKAIGDINIKAPSQNIKNKVSVFSLIIYKLAYVGFIMFLIILALGNFYYGDHESAWIAMAIIPATIVVDLIIRFIIRSYKEKLSEL